MSRQQSTIDRGNRLESKVEEFNKRVSAVLGDFEWDDQEHVATQHNEDEEETLEDNDMDETDVEEEVAEQENCIGTTLWMPSTFGREFCFKNGWEKIVDQEMQLRIAQAEESLEELRLAIGHKSLVYKISVRKSKTQAKKNRSRTELLQVNDKIKDCAWRYRRARSALLSLGASTDTLDKFQPLRETDLKVNTDVAEENRIGQRNDTLAWFWRIGGGDSSDNPWMNESEFRSAFCFAYLY